MSICRMSLLMMFLSALPSTGICAQDIHTVYVNSDKELRDPAPAADGDFPVHLYLRRFKLKNDRMSRLKSAGFFDRIEQLTLDDIKMSQAVLQELLTAFDKANLTKLTLTGVTVEEYRITHRAFYIDNFAQNLETLQFRGCKMSKQVWSDIFSELVGKTPRLKFLQIAGCELRSDFVKTLKELDVVRQLESLDLSGNNLTNEVLTIFPGQTEGKLETLKLNHCGLTLDADRKYGETFPTLSSSLDPDVFAVDWSALFFKRLRHLEIEEVTANRDRLLKLYSDPALQRLDIFLGFVLAGNKKHKITEDEELEFYRSLAELPILSKRNNYRFQGLKFLNQFARGRQGTLVENINLAGKRWYDSTIRLVLDANLFPKLTTISLSNAKMSEEEIYYLIQDYPQFSFDIILDLAMMGKAFYLSSGIPGFLPRTDSFYRPLSFKKFKVVVTDEIPYWPRLAVKQSK